MTSAEVIECSAVDTS